MATKDDIDADLTLELDGRNVTPEKFMKAVRAFFGLVNEITRELAGPKEFVNWTVQVKDGSNLVGILPAHANVSPVILDNIYALVHEGIASLENSADEPEGLPEPALKHIRDLGSVAGSGDEDDDTKVWIWSRKLPAPITHKAASHVATLMAESYEDFGSIDGRVQVISDEGDLHVFISEPVGGRRIRCFFEEEMLPRFLAAFRHRVEVKGKIKYRRDHKPISIFATGLTEYPGSKELPSFREMRGIFRE
jgi:hypothetical protein